MTFNLLGLPEYRVIGSPEELEHDFHFQVEIAKTNPRICPHCHCTDVVVHGYLKEPVIIKDLPMRGKRVGLYVNPQRFRCRAAQCGKTFTEALPAVDEKRRMTIRLVAWIGKESIRRTFTSIADDVGVVVNTVRAIFQDHVTELERQFKFEAPRRMGIDEIHIIKKPRAVISNIHANTIVDMLPDRNKKTVATYLTRLDGHKQVQYVAIDMWAPYRDAVYAVIPQAKIVVDKFHVVRMANVALESARKSMRESLTPQQRRGLMHDRYVLLRRRADLTDEQFLLLDGWIRNYPMLGEAYRLKEEFFGIYDAKDVQEAKARYAAWAKSIPADLVPHFQPILTAWKNWHPEILEYFNHRITNAFAESANAILRALERAGRGYSFEALRAKILFLERAHKRTRPRFERQSRGGSQMIAEPTFGYGIPGESLEPPAHFRKFRSHDDRKSDEEKNFGVDVSTLLRLIERGEF